MNRIGMVVQETRFVKVYCNGKDISKEVPQAIRLAARDAGKDVECIAGEWVVSGQAATGIVSKPDVELEEATMVKLKATESVNSTDGSIVNITNFVHREAAGLKPSHFFISDLKWKYLIRAVMRGRNVLMTGPAGTGKTMAVKHVVNALNRPHFYFNMGATQDPRTTLIGNTHFKKDSGTYFAQSLFVTAIQTPNAVILLDEISRAHPEAGNLLMPVLDMNQRYLRLDEKDDSPTIPVAEGVSFIGTANIGNEYTGTRTMDRALKDRFSTTIEMEELNSSEELRLLKLLYPKGDKQVLGAIADIAGHTRENIKSENPKVGTTISTRMAVEMGSLSVDGFSLAEIADVTIYPFYSEEGGVDSERVYMKQLVQKYIKTTDSKLFGDGDTVAPTTASPF